MKKLVVYMALGLCVLVVPFACGGDDDITVSSGGYSLTVKSVSSPASYDGGDGQAVKASPGGKLVLLEVALQLPAQPDAHEDPLFFLMKAQFKLIDTEGASYEPSVVEARSEETYVQTGTVVFGVPHDAEMAQLKCDLSSVRSDAPELVVDF